jgi:hypothetical protein
MMMMMMMMIVDLLLRRKRQQIQVRLREQQLRRSWVLELVLQMGG